MACATVHGDNKENIPCVTGVVWKITSVASRAVYTTCVHVNRCAVSSLPQAREAGYTETFIPTLLTCLHTAPTLVTVTVPPPILQTQKISESHTQDTFLPLLSHTPHVTPIVLGSSVLQSTPTEVSVCKGKETVW